MSRTNQLNQEFAFMPTQPPHAEGGIFELRTYLLQPGTLLEWENSWYVTPRWERFLAYLTLICEIKGEEVSRPDVNLLLQWVHGSPKSGDFTKYTICGNIRERFPSTFLAKQLMTDSMPRNLQKRRDIREKAWQNDGWAETVSKARFPMSWIEVTLLIWNNSRRRSWHSQWMLLFWRRCHSVLWNKICIVCIQYCHRCHPQIAKLYDVSHVSFESYVIEGPGIGGDNTWCIDTYQLLQKIQIF